MHICPITGCELRRARAKGGIIWFSPESGGRMLTLAMVRHYLGEDLARELWLRSETGRKTEKKCPSCTAPMVEVSEPGWSGGEVVDVCRRCYLVWLDEGEHMGVPHPHVDTHAGVVEAEQRIAKEAIKAEQIRNREENQQTFATPDAPLEKMLPALLLLPIHSNQRGIPVWPLITCGVLTLSFIAQYFTSFLEGPWLGMFRHPDWLLFGLNVYFVGMFTDDVEEDMGYVSFASMIGLLFAINLLGQFFLPSTAVFAGLAPLVTASMAYFLLRFPQCRVAYIFPAVHHVDVRAGGHFWVRGIRWLRLPVWVAVFSYFGLEFILRFRADLVEAPYFYHFAGLIVGTIWYFMFGAHQRKFEMEGS